MSKGRGNGNTITTGEAVKLKIDYLFKEKYIKAKCETHFHLSWTNGCVISCIADFTNNNKYLRLMYSVVNNTTKETKQFDYKIYFSSIKSNLGKGSNLYFICPQSYRDCKILYLCYGSDKFKCRSAYNHKIYYSTQIASKESRDNARFFKLESKIEKLNTKRTANNYNGVPTKRKNHLLKLTEKLDYIDELRFQQIDKFLSKMGYNS